MRLIKHIVAILALFALMMAPVAAQPELPNPGITPDSPFYFLDRAFDVFRSNEAVMDRRAAEVVAMAEKGHERGLERALTGYDRAVEKRNSDAEKNENVAEEVARQATNHLAVLANVREQVPEQARAGIDQALNRSAQGREDALSTLEQQNSERAGTVAQATLQEVMANTPAQAQEGLQRALNATQTRGPPAQAPTNIVGDAGAQAEEQRIQAQQRETDARERGAQAETTAREQAGNESAPTQQEIDAREEGSERESTARENRTAGRP